MSSTIPVTSHEHVEVLTSTAELLAVDCTWTDGGELPPAHYHPSQDEHFEVLEGTLRVIRDGVETNVSAGESFDVPRGTVHAIIPADGAARARWEIRPALKTEAFFREMAQAGGKKSEQIAVVARHRDEFRLAGPLGVAVRALSAVRLAR
jgi:quercetin dioxygenase-like cupin family protein